MMKLNKKNILDMFFRLTIVILSNLILAIATVWFLEPAKLYSGGATGLAQLIQRLVQYCGGNINLGIVVFLINIPIVIIGFKFVSRKFAIYSIVAVVVQSVATALLTASPFQSLVSPIVTEQGTVMNYGGILTLAIFGGLLSGVASGIALRFGTSTGGIDVVGQSLALHKNISIGNITMVFNVIVALIGGAILQGSWVVFLFTVVRMILNSLVMDKIHTAYTYTGVNIFTDQSQNISEAIMTELKRGCTFINVEGAYSHHKSVEVFCVVSTYEVEKTIKIVHRYDEHAFITLSPVKGIKGNFIKKSII
ncbi:MAG: YitT family protein [Acholeplasmatales bacterium]|nr:YitT family protein [Acholeplasmatales bacterium]